MINRSVYLDQNIDVLKDDRGRIVLLPRDHRDPMRFSADDEAIVEWLRDGSLDFDGRSDKVSLSEPQRQRFIAIVARLDQYGLLSGRRHPSTIRVVRFEKLRLFFDGLASTLTSPFTAFTTTEMRGRMLIAAAIAIAAALAALWWTAGGRMFAGLITPYWWLGIAVFILAFPIVHEFSHALAARMFGLEVTAVGVESRGGFSWSPFVEVRHAVLSSDPMLRIWIPLMGVICNLFMALVFGLLFVFSSPHSPSWGIIGIVVFLMHLRVIIDGGFGLRTDASQALRIAEELLSPILFRRWKWVVRGGYIAFVLATIGMIALSLNNSDRVQ
jgi:hypothetical protein